MENEIVFYTNAPEAYDGFGTRTLEVTEYIDQRKTPVRKIAVPERAVVWQKNRNASGMNVTIEEDDFENVKDVYFTKKPAASEPLISETQTNQVMNRELYEGMDTRGKYFAVLKNGRIMTSGGSPVFADEPMPIKYWLDLAKKYDGKLYVANKPLVWSSLVTGDIMGYTFQQISDLQQKKEIQQSPTFTINEDVDAVEIKQYEDYVKEQSNTGTVLKLSDYKNPYEVNRAIERLLDEKGDEPESYTPDEIAFIGNYSGYGGLEKYGKFSDEELKGLLYEFFTPDEVVKKMWGLAYKHGYGMIGDNSVFEPSVGVGAFLKYAPDDVFVAGNEINRYSAMICHILYPNAEIRLMPFEKNFIQHNMSVRNQVEKLPILENRKFSLVIGNPPYGKIGGVHFAMGEDKYSRAQNFVEYFIFRGLDLLVKGGLLIYIVGAEQYNGGSLFLDSGMTPIKQAIFDKAELIDAYRLPTKIFERTGVSSEIVIFRKR